MKPGALLNLLLFMGAAAWTNALVAFGVVQFVPLTMRREVQRINATRPAVLIVGSSYTAMGVDPELVSEVCGVPAGVLALPGMYAEEADFLLRLIDYTPELYVIEVGPSSDTSAIRSSFRNRYWRSWRDPRKWNMVGIFHDRAGTVEPVRITEATGPDFHPEEYREALGKGLRFPLEVRYDYSVYERQHERLGEVLHFIPPSNHDVPGFERALDYNEVKQYPDLFAVEVRWNRSHLNREGANRFSRLLGGAIRERLGRETEPGGLGRER